LLECSTWSILYGSRTLNGQCGTQVQFPQLSTVYSYVTQIFYSYNVAMYSAQEVVELARLCNDGTVSMVLLCDPRVEAFFACKCQL